MSEPVDVALANDFQIVVLGLARLLAPYDYRIRVVDVVVRGEPIAQPVDLVLFDVFAHVEQGRNDLAALVDDPNVGHLAIFTWYLDEVTVQYGLEHGVSGYLAKNLSADELVDGIERIAAGERVVVGHDGADYHSTPRDWPGRAEGLSERESEIVILIAEGLTNTEIAAALYLSTNSVKTHIRHAYRKLSVERRSQAVRAVLELGFARRAVDRARWDALRHS